MVSIDLEGSLIYCLVKKKQSQNTLYDMIQVILIFLIARR